MIEKIGRMAAGGRAKGYLKGCSGSLCLVSGQVWLGLGARKERA
ncbi:dak phosphatase [Neisseria shayeganii 871]|uniref:Dak phosphatase n=1 Tax=Neisseria shayeganii 871 TaxID=1032488 RepID=G4CGF2_9NEIS|nr:dak phosphatase [Neisseria shayeganii 871]